MIDPYIKQMKPDFYRIEAEQVCVDYNGTVALYDASLKLKSGCICGLVGMNGAGKSTFFKALMGFVRPSNGTIRINGFSVLLAQRDQAVAYVPQSEGIDCSFPISVWDVVMMGRYGSMNPLRIPRNSLRVHKEVLMDSLGNPYGSIRESLWIHWGFLKEP